jgi:hypothetical protein
MILKLPNVLDFLIISHLRVRVEILYVLLLVIEFYHHQILK